MTHQALLLELAALAFSVPEPLTPFRFRLCSVDFTDGNGSYQRGTGIARLRQNGYLDLVSDLDTQPGELSSLVHEGSLTPKALTIPPHRVEQIEWLTERDLAGVTGE